MPVLESFRVGVFGFLVKTSSLPSTSFTTGSFGSASLRLAVVGIYNGTDWLTPHGSLFEKKVFVNPARKNCIQLGERFSIPFVEI